MAEPLTVKFTPLEKDYVQATRYVMSQGYRRWITLGGMGLVEAGLLITLASRGNEALRQDSFMPVLALLLPLLMLWLYFGVPWQAGRSVRNNSRTLAEVTWVFGDEGPVVSNGFTETKFDWGSFQSLTENGDYFFLRQSAGRRFYQFIPKRAFASPDQENQFREIMGQHIPATTNAKNAVSSTPRS